MRSCTAPYCNAPVLASIFRIDYLNHQARHERARPGRGHGRPLETVDIFTPNLL